ncbi:hypothetical protein B0H19DRAFT_1272064 [Mycena capillaripes]|nr:hypothetical protein B0H19DRAFT_1272064 [Mycena capillaripes]
MGIKTHKRSGRFRESIVPQLKPAGWKFLVVVENRNTASRWIRHLHGLVKHGQAFTQDIVQNASGLQVLELLEHIVAFLHDDPQTLRSCASASRLLVSAAQLHLFHTITYDIPSDPRYISPDRLTVIVSHSPHLAAHIRCLDLAIDREGTAQLARLTLPNLAHLILHAGGDITDPALTAGVHLIALPSVRSVTLSAIGADLRVLARLFEECTPNLQEVAFLDCVLRMKQHDYNDFRMGRVFRTTTRRTRLAGLVVSSSFRIIMWLLEGDCPFDLSQLTSVNMARNQMSMDRHIHTLLETTRLTLERLTISLYDITGGAKVDLTHFPSLTHLSVKFELSLHSIPALTAALARCADFNDGLREIVIISIQWDWLLPEKAPLAFATVLPILPAFDEALSALPLPKLERVVLQVILEPEDDDRWGDAENEKVEEKRSTAESESLLRRWFPSLVSKGLLDITWDNRVWRKSPI